MTDLTLPTPAQRARAARRWLAFVALVLTLIALMNGVLIVVTQQVHPQLVEAHPYLACVADGDAAAALKRFRQAGATLAVQADGARRRITLSAAGALATPAVVQVYRPDAPALDQELDWRDGRVPLPLQLPRPGIWHLHLTSRDGRWQADCTWDEPDGRR